MLNLTRLYGGVSQPADALRYGHGPGATKTAAERRPIVVCRPAELLEGDRGAAHLRQTSA